MRTEHAGTARRRGKRASSAADAIGLLKKDHQEVLDLFRKFEKLAGNGSAEEKSRLVSRICDELKIHTALEEELFYPAVRAAIDEELLMDEALVEHDNARNAIAQLENMEPGDDRYDAIVCVLAESIRHHVKEEQNSVFPKARKAKMDLAGLGEEMAVRKRELKESGGLALSA